MIQNHKAIFAIAAGITFVALHPLIGIGVRMYHTRLRELDDVIPESYWIIGTFGPGFHNSYEPENQPDPNKPCKTPSGEKLQWVVKNVIPRVKCLDFRRELQKQNTDNSAAYALVYIHSHTDQAGEILLGSDDTITVWVNASQIHRNMTLRPGREGQDQAAVEWKHGWNTMLIKVGNWKGDHLFFAKLRRAKGLRASTTTDELN